MSATGRFLLAIVSTCLAAHGVLSAAAPAHAEADASDDVVRALDVQMRIDADGRVHVTTAEANQIRFEESIDVFSRYLPYAIVFGVADRWAQVFEQLRAEGRGQVHTGWYLGGRPGAMPSLSSIGSSMTSMASTTSPTSGSGGGSGFGGGGGAGGGGGGGGGGGR